MLRHSCGKIVPAILAVVFLCVGCHTSSHRAIRIYEYDDAPPKRQVERELSEDEYRMQSPGEMVSPGAMVPPGSPRDPD